MGMLIAALAVATIGLAALVTAFVSGNEAIGWVSIAGSVIGFSLLAVDAVRVRRHPAVQSTEEPEEEEILHFEADYPDDITSVDAPVHAGDHAVQREIMQEERVVHPDTGPRDPDTTREEVAEVLRHRGGHRSSRHSSG